MADFMDKMIGALDMLDTSITDTARTKWLQMTFGVDKEEANEVIEKWKESKKNGKEKPPS